MAWRCDRALSPGGRTRRSSLSTRRRAREHLRGVAAAVCGSRGRVARCTQGSVGCRATVRTAHRPQSAGDDCGGSKAMKSIFLGAAVTVLVFAGCKKQDQAPTAMDELKL